MNESSETTYPDAVRLTIVRLEFDIFCSISHGILIILGIPLNLFIFVFILSSKRLKKKPRNILFLGVSTASLFTLFTMMFELIANNHQNPIFCKITGLGLGAAYTCLLNNILLALIDRYLAIVSPLFHRKTVTVKSVWMIQISAGIAIYISIKWPYLFGLAPLQCGFLMFEAKTIAVQQAILIFLCIILYILVYLKTRNYICPNRAISVSFVNNRRPFRQPSVIQDEPVDPPAPVDDRQAATVSLKSDSNNSHQQHSHRLTQESETSSFRPSVSIIKNNSTSTASLQVHAGANSTTVKPAIETGDSQQPHHISTQGRGEVHPPTQQQQVAGSAIQQTTLQVHGGSRTMEMEATFTLLAGVSSLLIFSAPTVIVGFIDWGCRLILSDVEHQGQYCSKVMVSMPYLREFLFYHLVYNPIMYMIRNKEFSSTLTEKWARILHRYHQPQFIYSDGAVRNRILNNRPMLLISAHVPPTAFD